MTVACGGGGVEPEEMLEAPEMPPDAGVIRADAGSGDAGGPDAGTGDAGEQPEAPTLGDVEAIIRATCAPCHTGVNAAGLLNMEDFLGATVGIPAQLHPDVALVEPGDADASYLVQKLRGEIDDGTSMMPPDDSPSRRPTSDEIEVIASFIDALPPG